MVFSYLSSLSEELISGGGLGLTELLEEVVVDGGGVDTVEVDGGRGWDHVGLGNSSEWDTVDFVWTGDQKQAGLELLEENYSSASESAAEDNQNSSWLDGLSKLGWLWSFVGPFEWGLDVVASVELDSAHFI